MGDESEGDGWADSAQAWIADMGDAGDWGRRVVLDAPMLSRVDALAPATALDVGCGEGRFCRMLSARGISVVGIDPTEAFLDHARALDSAGDYRAARAEALPFADSQFDLVVSYLSLIDIPDARAGIAEMARVLKPGGRLLIANLNGFNTAALKDLGWVTLADGRTAYALDDYLLEGAEWTEWRGIRIVNHHRPLGAYMRLLLEQGLTLTHFEEPAPHGDDTLKAVRYRRAPWYLIMEWAKP